MGAPEVSSNHPDLSANDDLKGQPSNMVYPRRWSTLRAALGQHPAGTRLWVLKVKNIKNWSWDRFGSTETTELVCLCSPGRRKVACWASANMINASRTTDQGQDGESEEVSSDGENSTFEEVVSSENGTLDVTDLGNPVSKEGARA